MVRRRKVDTRQTKKISVSLCLSCSWQRWRPRFTSSRWPKPSPLPLYSGGYLDCTRLHCPQLSLWLVLPSIFFDPSYEMQNLRLQHILLPPAAQLGNPCPLMSLRRPVPWRRESMLAHQRPLLLLCVFSFLFFNFFSFAHGSL